MLQTDIKQLTVAYGIKATHLLQCFCEHVQRLVYAEIKLRFPIEKLSKFAYSFHVRIIMSFVLDSTIGNRLLLMSINIAFTYSHLFVPLPRLLYLQATRTKCRLAQLTSVIVRFQPVTLLETQCLVVPLAFFLIFG